jgi:hypothetical protein
VNTIEQEAEHNRFVPFELESIILVLERAYESVRHVRRGKSVVRQGCINVMLPKDSQHLVQHGKLSATRYTYNDILLDHMDSRVHGGVLKILST